MGVCIYVVVDLYSIQLFIAISLEVEHWSSETTYQKTQLDEPNQMVPILWDSIKIKRNEHLCNLNPKI